MASDTRPRPASGDDPFDPPDREVSVVIPTFNRSALVLDSIASALPLADHADTEIIVADDASTDDTKRAVREAFPEQARAGIIRIVSNTRNAGVTATRNTGARFSRGDWVVQFDSDDLLRRESLSAMVAALRAAGTAPMVFFRCADAQGRLHGEAVDGTRTLTTRDLLAGWRWGECLPVLRRTTCLQCPYDGDLRGFEGLCYMRVTQQIGPALLSPLIVRTYREQFTDRLSTAAGMRRRSCELARGNLRVLREFRRELGVAGVAKQCARIGYYGSTCLSFRLRGR